MWVGFGRIREMSRRPGKPRVSCRGLQRGEGTGEQAARGEATGGVKAVGAWPRCVRDGEQGSGRAWGCLHAR